MKRKFNSIIINPNQKEMIQLDPSSMVLYLNPGIWDVLPSDQNDFVLYQQEGSMMLETTEAYKDKMLPAEHFDTLRILSAPDSNKTIRVLSTVAAQSNISGFWSLSSSDPSTDSGPDSSTDTTTDQDATSVIGSALQVLPLLVTGPVSQQADTAAAATAAGQKALIDAQAKAAEDAKRIQGIIISVISAIILLSIVAYFALRTK